MFCSSGRSNLVSFLSVKLSPPCELPVESPVQRDGGIPALVMELNGSGRFEKTAVELVRVLSLIHI